MSSVRFTPKCIVRCRDNDIDLSYRRRAAGPRRLSLAGSKINETLFSLPHAMVMVAERENGGETERDRDGQRAKLRLARRERSIDRVIAGTRSLASDGREARGLCFIQFPEEEARYSQSLARMT